MPHPTRPPNAASWLAAAVIAGPLAWLVVRGHTAGATGRPITPPTTTEPDPQEDPGSGSFLSRPPLPRLAKPHPHKEKVMSKPSNHAFLLSVMSGRFDAPAAKVREAFDREKHAGASVIFTTEQDNADRAKALHQPGDGYGEIRNNSGVFKRENVVLFSHADWTLDSSGQWKLNDGDATRGRGQYPSYATWGILTNKHNGHQLLTVAVHMPAHLFKASRFYQPAFIKMWWSSLGVLHTHVAQVRRAHPGIAVAIAGDPNAKATWVANAIHKAIPGARQGSGGMFGNAWTVGLQKLGATTLGARGSSDHPIQRLHYRWA